MTTNSETTAKTEPRFVAGKLREKRVALEWPVEYGGKTYEAIVVRRLTGQEVADFLDQLAATGKDDPTAKIQFPMFFGEDGERVPDELMGALDDDDAETIAQVTVDFLPRRFRGLQGSAPAPLPSEASPPTSPTS